MSTLNRQLTGGLHHLSIRTPDLGRAKQFYTETTGFGSLGPSLVHLVSGSDSASWAGWPCLCMPVPAHCRCLSFIRLRPRPSPGWVPLVSYLALSLPAIITGVVVVRTSSLELVGINSHTLGYPCMG
jgi:hypothetical protein